MPSRPVTVTFDTLLRDDGSTNYDRYTFTVNPALENVVGVQVQECNIPYSYYTIDRLCNSFAIITTDALAVSTEYTVYLRPGTYNPDTLEFEMKRAIGTVSGLRDAADYVVFMEPATARLVIYNPTLDTTLAGENFAIRVDNADLASILGFAAGTTYTASTEQVWRSGAVVDTANTNDVAYVVRAPGLCNLTYSPRIEVHSQILSGLLAPFSRLHNNVGTMIQSMPVTSNFTSFLYYLPGSQMLTLNDTVRVDTVDLYLRLPGRSLYAANSSSPQNNDYIETNYLPLNGEGFQIKMVFYVDDGFVDVQEGVDPPAYEQHQSSQRPRKMLRTHRGKKNM